MTQLLSNICDYINEKIAVNDLSDENYISTENMLPNKSGIVKASTLPNLQLTPAYQENDVLISNIRPYFRKIWQAEYCGGCSNDVLVLRAKKSVNPKFLYYVLSEDKFFDYATATSKGTKMPRGDKTAIMKYEVPEFSETEQEKIANILFPIDEKIAINSATNNNLEQQAQAIFNNKFVNIESIPNNWETSNLSTIADYLNGLAMQKFRPNNDEIGIPVLKIKELRQGFCDNQSDLCSPNIKSEYLINDGDVIFSWSGTLWLDLWCSGLCGLNQHLFKVTSSKYDKWFYYFWTKYHLNKFIAIAADKATTMGHIKREDLDKSEVLIPDDETYTQLTSLLSPILELIIKNKVENRQLIQLRDTLLPKLMSGEIDVTNVDISTDKLSFSCLNVLIEF